MSEGSFDSDSGVPSVSHSFSNLKTTSAQLAIVLALRCYGAQYGALTNADLTEDQLQKFLERFDIILLNLLSEDSIKQLESTQTISFSKTQRRPFSGKLGYFDNQDKIMLSKPGIEELKAFRTALNSISSLAHADAHHVNEFSPPKTAPVSSRRVAFLSSLLNSLGILLAYEIIFDEDFLSEEMDESSMQTIENSSSVIIGMLFSLMAVLTILKNDKEKRTREISEQFRRSCIKAMLKVKEDDSTVITDINEVVKNLNNEFNVEILKGVQSAEGAKTRSYYTVASSVFFGSMAVAASVALLLTDCATMSVSFWIRLGLAVVATAVVTEIRYRAKEMQNQRKLYAKIHRKELNHVVQTELLAELAVYGLQPVEKQLLTATTVNIKRQVQVDVENFLKELEIEVLEKRLKVSLKKGESTKLQMFCHLLTNEKTEILKNLEKYIREHIPEKYRLNDKYFVKEFLFQVRVNHLGDEEEIVAGEREQCFCQPAAEFIARKDNVSIQKMNRSILIYQNQAKTHCHDISLPNETEILEKMNRNLCWPPYIYLKKTPTQAVDEENLKQQIKNQLLYSIRYYIYAATRFETMPWQKNDAVLNAYYIKYHESTLHKLAIKKTKRTTKSNFHSSSATLFKQFIKNDPLAKKTTINPEFEGCSNKTFSSEATEETTALLAATKVDGSNKIGQKTLEEQHMNNMEGVGIAAAMSSIPAALGILYPVLGYVANFEANIGVQVGVYSFASMISKYSAISYRRNAKHAARCSLQQATAKYMTCTA